ncbi:hypothetical protein IJ425_00655, partial [bacterium]|nr:hypothetical protein [bacterium]
MFGVKRKVAGLCFSCVLATTLVCSAADINVTSFTDFKSGITSGSNNIYVQNDLYASSNIGENSSTTVIDGGGFDIYGENYTGIYNSGDLKIINVGSVEGDLISNGFSRFGENQTVGEATLVEPMTVDNAGVEIYNAITNAGTLDISNTNFMENQTTGMGGAAISNTQDGTITSIDNVNFYYNQANTGGAIINEGGIVNKIANSTFVNNSAFGGGAIANMFDGNIDLIDNVTFEGNYSDEHGGAIANMEAYITDITNSKFIKNEAYRFGGAIRNFEQSYIDNINAEFTSNIGWQGGGAIMNSGYIGSINGTFVDNQGQEGGAIFNTGADVMGMSSEDNGVIESITGIFDNNYANSYGGAIYSQEGFIGSIIGEFKNNTAGTYSVSAGRKSGGNDYSDGGAIYNFDNTIGEIKDSVFENNSVNASYEAYGGAISNSEGTIYNIENVTFKNNTSKAYEYAAGGAISNYDGYIGSL